MHFLEAARFPKAPVLAGRKVLYAPQCQLTVRLTAPPRPTSQCLGPETNTLIILSYLILSYLILSYIILSYIILYYPIYLYAWTKTSVQNHLHTYV